MVLFDLINIERQTVNNFVKAGISLNHSEFY